MRTAVDVHNYLVERNIPHEIVATEGRVREPDRWATVLGLDPEMVARVELFEGRERPIAALVRADRTADPARVAEAAGEDAAIRPVSEDRAVDLTEFLHEALPPVALPEGTLVLLDEPLAEEEVLFLPGGEAASMLKIGPSDLLRASEGTMARLT